MKILFCCSFTLTFNTSTDYLNPKEGWVQTMINFSTREHKFFQWRKEVKYYGEDEKGEFSLRFTKEKQKNTRMYEVVYDLPLLKITSSYSTKFGAERDKEIRKSFQDETYKYETI